MANDLKIDGGRCRMDGLCVRVCPKVFTQDGPGKIPQVTRPKFCNECGHCLLICPANAITHKNIDPARIRHIGNDRSPSFDEINTMIRTRRSIRNFTDQPVKKELIERVIDAARFAPSAKNTQSTHYTVIQDARALKQIASMTAKWLHVSAKRLRNPIIRRIYLLRGLVAGEDIERWIAQFELTARNMQEGIDTILYNAPALILFHAQRRIRFAETNANLAQHNGTLLACTLGLGNFYTGYVVMACRRSRAIPDLLGIPRDHDVYAGMALGHVAIGFSRWIDRNPAGIKWI